MITLLTTIILLAPIIIGIVAIIISIISRRKIKYSPNKIEYSLTKEIPPETEPKLQIRGFYQPKWLFSYNEKDAYNKLKTITEKHNLPLFAKVRLLDLVEPVKQNNPKYKTYLYKIQAKHVDFVICNEKLVAKLIIELDDSSHDTEDRQERDKFVDEVLTSTGYKIIHTRTINETEIEAAIQEIKM